MMVAHHSHQHHSESGQSSRTEGWAELPIALRICLPTVAIASERLRLFLPLFATDYCY